MLFLGLLHISRILTPTQAIFTREQKRSMPPSARTSNASVRQTWRHTAFSVAVSLTCSPQSDDRFSRSKFDIM
jgi:hypothetical protein